MTLRAIEGKVTARHGMGRRWEDERQLVGVEMECDGFERVVVQCTGPGPTTLPNLDPKRGGEGLRKNSEIDLQSEPQRVVAIT